MVDGRRSRSAMDTLTELDARLGSAAFAADPYPVFAALRSAAPVHWSDAWGFWVVTRYADVTAILRDPRRFSNVGRSAPVERVPDEQRKRLAPMFDSFRVGMPSTDPPVAYPPPNPRQQDGHAEPR